MKVIPTKRTAVTSIPVWKVNTEGMRAVRTAPPATYWREVMTIMMRSWARTLIIRACFPYIRSIISGMVFTSMRRK